MLLRRFYDTNLAQASYLVGCQATGEALVIDPNRNIEQYVRAVAEEEMRISHVTETHIHADFVSGARELARGAGATLLLSDEGGEGWRYGYAGSDGAVLLHDGDTFNVGNVVLEAVHTPGHTPEHLSFLLTDTAGADRPMGILTGDFIFVGDVGRPDLLERAAGVAGTMDAAARQLFYSVQRAKSLADYLQIWPGHGAGSACGRALGAVPQSTLGYEKMFNWAFGEMSEEEFVRAVLVGQPEAPKYFVEMKRINRDGPFTYASSGSARRLETADLVSSLRGGGLVVDTRPASSFAAGHVPGTISIPLDDSFVTWAGWMIPYDRDFALVVSSEAELDDAIHALRAIGLDRVGGYLTEDELESVALEDSTGVTAAEAKEAVAAESALLLDVRDESEFAAGHIPGVLHIHLGFLEDRLDEIPRDRPVVVQCRSGNRSAIGQSVLLAHGFADVRNLEGGILGWAAQGFETSAA